MQKQSYPVFKAFLLLYILAGAFFVVIFYLLKGSYLICSFIIVFHSIIRCLTILINWYTSRWLTWLTQNNITLYLNDTWLFWGDFTKFGEYMTCLLRPKVGLQSFCLPLSGGSCNVALNGNAHLINNVSTSDKAEWALCNPFSQITLVTSRSECWAPKCCKEGTKKIQFLSLRAFPSFSLFILIFPVWSPVAGLQFILRQQQHAKSKWAH